MPPKNSRARRVPINSKAASGARGGADVEVDAADAVRRTDWPDRSSMNSDLRRHRK